MEAARPVAAGLSGSGGPFPKETTNTALNNNNNRNSDEKNGKQRRKIIDDDDNANSGPTRAVEVGGATTSGSFASSGKRQSTSIAALISSFEASSAGASGLASATVTAASVLPSTTLSSQGNTLVGGSLKTGAFRASVKAKDAAVLTVRGGAENAQFVYLDSEELGEYSIRSGDVVLEVEGQSVAGYTRADVQTLLDYCANRGQHTLALTFIQAEVLNRDIRAYLNCRFPQGSPEHDLQNTIRDNLYIRTVPCTTRTPRVGEVNGVDYHFLTREEFASLEREGKLLESGFFEGNFYGTPLPNIQIQGQSTSLKTPPLLVPGAHPTSEGKRKRNRSNVEAFLNSNKPLSPSSTTATTTMAPSTSGHLEQLAAGSDVGSGNNNSTHGKINNGDNNNSNNNNSNNNSQQEISNHSSSQLFNNHSDNSNTSGYNGYRNLVDSGSYDGHAAKASSLHCQSNNNTTSSNDMVYVGEALGEGGGSCGGQYGEGTTIVDDDLGPLPPHWEKAYTEQGEPYFINLNTNKSQWDDPRLCGDDGPDGGLGQDDRSIQMGQLGEGPGSPLTPLDQMELPYGWERIDDPQYGTYYIDHINKRTQYESPLATQATLDGSLSLSGGSPPRKIPPPTLPKPMLSQIPFHLQQHQALLPPQYQLPYVFTRNPAELVGEIIHVGLVKSPRGFGFTIIGGNDHQAEEFLQIKSITQGGPAWNDGTLRTGDVLVHVNGICVLGYTHGDVVSLFQSIAPGEVVHLQICRGYKLPFDPNDPNMEIVTTQAVTANGSYDTNVDKSVISDNENLVNRSVVGASREYNDIYGTVMRKMQSIDLSKGSLGGSAVVGANIRNVENASATLSSSNVEQHNSLHEESELDFEPPKFLTVEIVKGNTGFGFTIADSANGQKVKKILDETRCEDLVEGDILVDINGRNVRRSLHAEVVQVLKECLIGSTARITVQRGGFATSRSQATGARTPVNAADDAGSERGSHASTSFSQFNFNPNPTAFQYRSKTPTADLYGSAREVVIQRPKTPVVDTRNWECPEKPPRTGPQPGQQIQRLQHHPGGQTVPDANINNSIYGTTLGLGSRPTTAAYGNVGSTQPRFEEDVYGYVRSKSEVWHYDYPTPAGTRQSHTLARNAHSAVAPSQGEYANYYALYGNERGVTPQPSYDPTGQHSIYGTAESVRYAESLRAPSVQGGTIGASGAYGEGGNGEFQVSLNRQESGFGFRIVGGTEEGSQVTIGHIVPGGAADVDGSIQTGDEILSVDGHSVANASHHHVVQLIGAASISGQVTLGLRRRISNLHNTSGQSELTPATYTYNVIVERTENEGFGFVIISSVGRSGSTIGRIIEGSPAERCGRLQVGDRIHAVNGVSILDMHHEDIVNLIKVSGLTVALTIAPRTSSTGALSPGNNIQDDLSSIGTNRPLGPDDFNDQPMGAHVLSASSLVESQMLPPASPAGGPPEFRRVVLQRGARGFGFSIRGGREFHNMPLFVLRIAEMGPAQKSGQLHVGDQLLEVNGICTDGMTHAEAIGLIRQGGSTVTLLIKRISNNPPSGAAAGPSPYNPHHHLSQQQQAHHPQHPLTVESPPSLISHHSLGGPISQSSPRSPSAMLLHSPHHHPGSAGATGVPTSVHQGSPHPGHQLQQQQQQQQSSIYGTHGQWVG
ncbi:membrane-associated guanylate kinase, WW and PDZ domain-containing protein 3-like isoform X5 [Varroa destructor]|uniref:Uncharacterized protein n=1 Tax=Varroa destructor TaxID=109461 RepID=A0A7M7JVT4_VARDE|nr:membrane-associated guanylate kinase, WW and PDZ domain-containing protein 3-like isoform X5 [Varroa destructor]